MAEYATITKDTVAAGLRARHARQARGQGAKVVEGEDPWRGHARVNVLLLGSDAGVGPHRHPHRLDDRREHRHQDRAHRPHLPASQPLSRCPSPPDSPLRELYPSGTYGEPTCLRAQKDPSDQCMLNAIWTETDQYAPDHPDAYHGSAAPGRDEIRNVIGEILGLKIDHTVVIDLKGFQQLVDAMGGVTINVKLSGYGDQAADRWHSDGQRRHRRRHRLLQQPGMPAPHRQPGAVVRPHPGRRQRLVRQARQRCVVQAIVKQVNPASMVTKYAEVAQIARDNIYTDIPAAEPARLRRPDPAGPEDARSAASRCHRSNGFNPGQPRLRRDPQASSKRPSTPPAPTPPRDAPTPTTKTPTKTPYDERAPPVDECA